MHRPERVGALLVITLLPFGSLLAAGCGPGNGDAATEAAKSRKPPRREPPPGKAHGVGVRG